MNNSGDHFPVVFRLEVAVYGSGPGIFVIDEHHPVAYEDIVFDGNALADKGVAGDLAGAPDNGVLLDFYEGTDLRVVAEGVETAEDWDFVAAAGVDEVQGYYIAKPMPADTIRPYTW